MTSSSSRCVLVFLVVVLAVINGARGTNSEDTPEQYPYDKIRLPGDVVPLSYDLILHPNITDGKFLYTGGVKIVLQVKKETDKIIFHSLRIDHFLTFVHEVGHPLLLKVKKTLKNETLEQAMVVLESKLSTTKRYVLHILFAAPLRKELRGFYISSHRTMSGIKQYIATSHFEPTGARLAFPCFDEPAMKAKFRIGLVHQPNHVALSNMPVGKVRERSDGLLISYFEQSVKMSSYLVAFIVGEFASLKSKTKRGIEVTIYTPKDQISQAKYAAKITPLILDYYEKFFEINFPLPKMDLIGIPDFGAGAMENWGLVTYRLTNLLYDEQESSEAAKQNVAFVVAHELAHQWFGNLVTMKWWSDLWLNEGFACFVEDIGGDYVGGKTWKMFAQQFVTNKIQVAMALDSHVATHPVKVNVTNPSDIGSLFDHGITYNKGASLIRMLREFIGHDVFTKGLVEYLKTQQFGNADSDDLWASLSKAWGPHKGVSLKDLMNGWILQKGYPVINVRREGKAAHLTQERFISDTSIKLNITINTTWDIPVTWYHQHATTKQSGVFKKSFKKMHLKYNKGWIKINADEFGYYRVNYDAQNWKDLASQLNTNHSVLSPADRANLVDDAFSLAMAGKLSETQALEMTEYLTKETEYIPVKAALTSLAFLGDMLHGRPGYAAFEKYVLQQMSPLITKLGWQITGSHLEKFLRTLVLEIAVRHNHTLSVTKAKKLYDNWMRKKMGIPSDLREIVYHAGIKYGGEKEWNYMFQVFKKSQIPSEKQMLMFALAQTSDPKLLKKYLEMTLDTDVIKTQDTCYLIHRIAANPLGKKMSYEFINKHWHVFYQRYGTGINFRDLVALFTAIFGAGKTQAEFKIAKEFFDTHDVSGGKLASTQALANIRNHISWLERNEKVVVQWLKTKV